MITPMMNYTEFLLQAFADVISVEPLLDLFAIVLLCGICKMFKVLGS